MRAVIPSMRERGGGAIVAVSSTHGGNVAIPQQAAYQAAKAGLTALTRNAAVTYAATIFARTRSTRARFAPR